MDPHLNGPHGPFKEPYLEIKTNWTGIPFGCNKSKLLKKFIFTKNTISSFFSVAANLTTQPMCLENKEQPKISHSSLKKKPIFKA